MACARHARHAALPAAQRRQRPDKLFEVIEEDFWLMDPEKLHTIFEHKVDGDCNFTNLPHFPQNFIQQIVAPLCPFILRGYFSFFTP